MNEYNCEGYEDKSADEYYYGYYEDKSTDEYFYEDYETKNTDEYFDYYESNLIMNSAVNFMRTIIQMIIL